MSAAFSLDGVSVDFGRVRALDGVSLHIAPGERVALVGPSGGGKTTLLRLLNGMQSATTGRVQALGEDLATLAPREMRAVRAQIAFIHQQLALVPNLRVLQNVVMGRLGRRSFAGALRDVLWCPRAEVERIHTLLGRVGIPEKLYHRTDHLSGGQQQRVAVARALYQNPAALLADEPVSSIDPARARDTVSLLTGLSREHGLTLCMSLHHLELAREFFPRLIGLRQGRVVFDRAAADLTGEEFSRLYDLTRDELIDA